MDDLQRFSAQCWQLTDIMRIPVRALRVVPVRHSHSGVEKCAAELLKASQRPLYRFLGLPWDGFTLRLAKRNRARFNDYNRFVEEALQGPVCANLAILVDALDVWTESIEADSNTRCFKAHPCVAEMTALAVELESSIVESEVCSLLTVLRNDFLQLAETVNGEAPAEPTGQHILSVPHSS